MAKSSVLFTTKLHEAMAEAGVLFTTKCHKYMAEAGALFTTKYHKAMAEAGFFIVNCFMYRGVVFYIFIQNESRICSFCS